jgi:hypothetical protein
VGEDRNPEVAQVIVEISGEEVNALRVVVDFHASDTDEEAIQIHEIISEFLARAELALQQGEETT